ncbi:MAG TPA: MEDS domain-containing protein [Candidatus Elarobacter sp.]|jgi:hypothetical protein|nr:MEDS domain-containing protein [Candidatus Elarobacter sp.]
MSPHVVQLYDADEASLTRNVGRYFYEGWQLGEGMLVIAGQEHAAAFTAELERLGVDVAAAVRDHRLAVLDASSTLARFTVDGTIDRRLFRRTAEAALRALRPVGGAGIRAFGEMVGILWQAGGIDAAMELETLWNELQAEQRFGIFCAYPIDVFDAAFHAGAVDRLLCSHSELIPTGSERNLESAIERAMSDVLGQRAAGLRPLMTANFRPAWGKVPAGEALILWLRNNLPDYADEILGRARTYYRACA